MKADIAKALRTTKKVNSSEASETDLYYRQQKCNIPLRTTDQMYREVHPNTLQLEKPFCADVEKTLLREEEAIRADVIVLEDLVQMEMLMNKNKSKHKKKYLTIPVDKKLSGF